MSKRGEKEHPSDSPQTEDGQEDASLSHDQKQMRIKNNLKDIT